MRNHKCGTCRFYQEARLASSGWCHHPQRKTTSDIMIMVRKNELACRDEWAHDLWQPKTDQGGSAANSPFGELFSDRKVTPATESEIAAVIVSAQSPANSPADSPRGPDDIVLSELGVASEPLMPEPLKYVERTEPVRDWATPSSRPVEPPSPTTPASELGTRNAIIRAREAYRERSRLVAARSQEIARLAANADIELPSLTGDQFVPTADKDSDERSVVDSDPRDSSASEAPSRQAEDLEPTITDEPKASATGSQDLGDTGRDDIVRPNPQTTATSWDLRSTAEADTPVANAPQPDAASNAEIRHPFDTDHGDSLKAHDDADRDAGAPQDLAAALDQPRRAHHTSEPMWHDERTDDVPSISHPDARSPHSRDDFVEFDVQDENWENDVAYDNINSFGEDEAGQLFASYESDESDESELDRSDPEVVFAAAPWPDDDVVAEDDFHVFTDVTPGHDLSAHLPRTCRTCRDFRPAETGDRGWCANQWAFSHRRVVAADEVTPCEGTLGHWWLPMDEVWSGAADVSSHGQPTPLIDAWLPHQHEKEPTRRRS